MNDMNPELVLDNPLFNMLSVRDDSNKANKENTKVTNEDHLEEHIFEPKEIVKLIMKDCTIFDKNDSCTNLVSACTASCPKLKPLPPPYSSPWDFVLPIAVVLPLFDRISLEIFRVSRISHWIRFSSSPRRLVRTLGSSHVLCVCMSFERSLHTASVHGLVIE